MYIKFSDFINEKYISTLAPNDNRSNLSMELYNYVRSDEFLSWFGDWINDADNSSKILDENGEPLLVYHGSKNKFDSFDIEKQKNGWLGKGFYFTDEKVKAKEYGKYTIKAFLNIRNPFIVNGNEPNDVIREIKEKYKTINDELSITLKENEHDGIIFNHWDTGKMITCFYPEQIKIIS